MLCQLCLTSSKHNQKFLKQKVTETKIITLAHGIKVISLAYILTEI